MAQTLISARPGIPDGSVGFRPVRQNDEPTLRVITLETLAAIERGGCRLGYVLEELRSNEQPLRLH
jgi:hypothetical protein